MPEGGRPPPFFEFLSLLSCAALLSFAVADVVALPSTAGIAASDFRKGTGSNALHFLRLLPPAAAVTPPTFFLLHPVLDSSSPRPRCASGIFFFRAGLAYAVTHGSRTSSLFSSALGQSLGAGSRNSFLQ